MRVDYKELQFYWIINSYDGPIHGLCIHEGKICEFKNRSHPCEDCQKKEDLAEEDHHIVCDGCYGYDADWSYEVISIKPLRKIKLLIQKKLFEWCIGYHCSFDSKGKVIRKHYVLKRPKWFFFIVSEIYYYKYKHDTWLRRIKNEMKRWFK